MKLPVLAVVLVGCAGHSKFEPVVRKADKSQAALFKSALRALTEEGLEPQTQDADTGVIVSSWDEEELLGVKRRLRWRITVDDGRVRVASDCQQYEDTGITASWVKCGTQPDERQALATALAETIVDDAREPAPVAEPPPPPTANPALDAGAPLPPAADAGPM